ncbi:hypothetical protein N8Z89_00030 [bacterium]|nr:hypothetical protein [bacterium]
MSSVFRKFIYCCFILFSSLAFKSYSDVLNTADIPKLTPLNGKLYYTATDNEHGTELWQYNPQSQIASLIEDGIIGSDSSLPDNLIAFDDKLYFSRSSIQDSSNSTMLWYYNPQTGLTKIVSNIITEKEYFVEYEPWEEEWNGEGSGYYVMKPLNGFTNSVVYQDKLYFNANYGGLDNSYYERFFDIDTYEYNTAITSLIEISPATTNEVKETINREPYPTLDRMSYQQFVYQGRLYSVALNQAGDTIARRNVWSSITDIDFTTFTDANTNIYLSSWDYNTFFSLGINNNLVYTLSILRDNDVLDVDYRFYVHDIELGTSRYINRGNLSSTSPNHYDDNLPYFKPKAIDTTDAIYFTIRDNIAPGWRIDIYKLNKATEEISLYSNILATEDFNQAENLIAAKDLFFFNNSLYFSAYSSDKGRELYKVNNVSQEVELVADILLGSGSSKPENFTLFNDKMYFTVHINETETALAYFDDSTNTVTVIENNNIAPSIILNSDLQFDENSQVQIPFTIEDEDISAATNVGDEDNSNTSDELSISWQQTEGELELSLVIAEDNISFTAPTVTENTSVSFTVTVNDGEVTKAKTVNIEIVNVNHAPTIELSNNVSDNNDNLEINEGESITINAQATDADSDDELNITWQQTAGSVSLDLSAAISSYSFISSEVSIDESYSFSVTASDGELSTTENITITVINVNKVPTLTLTSSNDNNQVNEGETITINAQATDSDDDELNITWQQTAGSVSLDLSTANSSYSFTAPAVSVNEDYSFSVIASDGSLNATQSITIKVINQPVELANKEKSGGSTYWLLWSLLVVFLLKYQVKYKRA